MIAPEGYGMVGLSLLAGAILVVAGLLIAGPFKWVLLVFAVVVVGFTLFFFRDPDRTAPAEALEGAVLVAPADGRVVLVGEVEYEPLYLKTAARQVSIFLSPLDVHVNRVPVTGIVEYDHYVAGDYLVAWHPKASEKNERSQLGVRHPSGVPVLFKQIAGAVARRVVYHIGVGDSVRAGERFGIVKFGSRMDVLVPTSADITVAEGDRVRAGESVIGRLPVVESEEARVAAGSPDDNSGQRIDG